MIISDFLPFLLRENALAFFFFRNIMVASQALFLIQKTKLKNKQQSKFKKKKVLPGVGMPTTYQNRNQQNIRIHDQIFFY